MYFKPRKQETRNDMHICIVSTAPVSSKVELK